MPEDAFFESVSRMPETIQHMKFSACHDGKLPSRWGLLAVLHAFFMFTKYSFSFDTSTQLILKASARKKEKRKKKETKREKINHC